AHVIEQDDEHVGGVLWRLERRRIARNRVLERLPDLALELRVRLRDRQRRLRLRVRRKANGAEESGNANAVPEGGTHDFSPFSFIAFIRGGRFGRGRPADRGGVGSVPPAVGQGLPEIAHQASPLRPWLLRPPRSAATVKGCRRQSVAAPVATLSDI